MAIIISKLTEDEIKAKGIHDWPTWEAGVSEFDWTYDAEEHAYVLSGKVIVSTMDEEVVIEAKDYVVFPKGLSCRWKVIEPIRKHYLFK